MSFQNVYEDDQRARAYAKLEFPGTYYLAYREVPGIIGEYASGRRALDFGCGAGRSTRFMQKLGFETVGVDISRNMINQARAVDPDGDYRLISETGLSKFAEASFDLVMCAFPFDNVPTMATKVALFSELGRVLSDGGIIINLVSSPEIYLNEWASFSTKDFPENRDAQSGDQVRIIMKDVADQRPVEDILWSDDAYRETYRQAGLGLVRTVRPLGRRDEPYDWVSETKIAPWTIYILKRQA
ncbi:MAG: class I SAM-dependent methyltransferase [bacterium]